MWHVRLKILPARPRARACQRFSVGPSSAYAVTTTRSSPFQCRSGRDSAFATAERSTFSTSFATARCEKARIVRASGTERPRMRSVTSRALRALDPTRFAWARTVCCVSTDRHYLLTFAARSPAWPRNVRVGANSPSL